MSKKTNGLKSRIELFCAVGPNVGEPTFLPLLALFDGFCLLHHDEIRQDGFYSGVFELRVEGNESCAGLVAAMRRAYPLLCVVCSDTCEVDGNLPAPLWSVVVLSREFPSFLPLVFILLYQHTLSVQCIRLKNIPERGCGAYALCIDVAGYSAADSVLPVELSLLGDCYVSDILFMPLLKLQTKYELFCFDMDSTLVDAELLDELALKLGLSELIKPITEAGMRGEIDFQEGFKRRLMLLKGLDKSVLDEVLGNIRFTEGAELLIARLKYLGCKLALITGGFDYFADFVKSKFGFDYSFSCGVEFADGKLTGRIRDGIIDARQKAVCMRRVAVSENIDLSNTVAVGDGANDILMLQQAGLGIAFHAKAKVKAVVPNAISYLGLDAFIYLLDL